jgi:hypothetical protein
MKTITSPTVDPTTGRRERLEAVISSLRIDRGTRRLAKIRAAENDIGLGYAIRAFLRAWGTGDPRAQSIIEDAIQTNSGAPKPSNTKR